MHCSVLEEPPPVVRVVAIGGSLREGSYSRATARIALAGASEMGAETEFVDLRDYDLIFCCGKQSDEEVPEDVRRLRETVRRAQGIILSTPEYHGSVSGVLKNALDLMGWTEFEGKMLGLVGVSGGAMGALKALDDLRTIGRSLHAWVVPEQAGVPKAHQAFDEDGRLVDERLDERVREVGRQVARFARLHNARESMAFLEEWEQAVENPGG